jgi:hypothetical protein
MLLLELLDRYLIRATCILKHNCAGFLMGSMKNNRAFPGDQTLLITRLGDKENQVKSRSSDFQYLCD